MTSPGHGDLTHRQVVAYLTVDFVIASACKCPAETDTTASEIGTCPKRLADTLSHERPSNPAWYLPVKSHENKTPSVGYGSHCGQKEHIDGLVQERRNSSASAMELRLSCTNPWIHVSLNGEQTLIKFKSKYADAHLSTCQYAFEKWQEKSVYRESIHINSNMNPDCRQSATMPRL